MIRRTLIILIATCALACSDSDTEALTTTSGDGGGGGEGALGHPCPTSQVLVDGDCVTPGVGADGCAEGFVHDGEGSCEPIFPAGPCGDGEVALPGDTSCQPLADCGDGVWGNIPVEGNTEYVDASYPDLDSDGTEAKPWRTISEAVNDAESGAIVAVAAGQYVEYVELAKSVRIWGRCPSMVELDGGPESYTVAVVDADVEIHQIAVTAQAIGIIAAAGTLLLDRLWIHDTGHIGVALQDSNGPIDVIMTNSLIERATQAGLLQRGGTATLDRVVVRDTETDDDLLNGRGIEIQRSLGSMEPSFLDIQRSLIERNYDVSVMVFGSMAAIDATVVRETYPSPVGDHSGRAITVQPDPMPGDEVGEARATLTLTRSLLADSTEVALYISGSDALIEDVVIRDVMPQQGTNRGRGAQVTPNVQLEEPFMSQVTFRRTTVLRTQEVGMSIYEGGTDFELVQIREVVARTSDGMFGDGLIFGSTTPSAPSRVVASTITDASRAGLASFGAQVELGSSTISCAAFALNSEFAGEVTDLGDNLCGCDGLWEPCKLQSAGLAAPEPIDP